MLFYNQDWMHFMWTRYNAGIEVTEELLKEFIYSFKDTQITDFAMNVNGTISSSDSKVFETYADKYLATEENGVPVDFKDTFASVAYKLIYEKKIDMYKVWTDTLREIGIRPWLSFRTNDNHDNMANEPATRKSSYIDAHPEYHLASHRERTGYFDKCLDFSHKEVRDRLLAYIDEQLGRYDVYGVELDFMRDAFFVQFGRESGAAPIMGRFVKDIIAVIEKYEKAYGHPIKRSVILPSNPNLLIERGMNFFDFADEIDYVVIISRWETTDTDMSIELWKQLLRGTDIKLGCGQQVLAKPYVSYRPVISSVKMAFGQAVANLSRGGDFVYLYNYMDFGSQEGILANYMYEGCIKDDAFRSLMFNNLGEFDTALKQERSHVVTFNDFWRYDNPFCSVLPINYPIGEFARIKIPVGKVPEGANLRLILGICGDEVLPEDIKVYVNATESKFLEKTKIEEKIFDGDCYAFSVEGEMYDVMYAEVQITKKCSLDYVEIEVKPA